MLNLGIDFGSTYTTVSVYRDGKPEAVLPAETASSPFIPSVVTVDRRERFWFGATARMMMGTRGCRVLRAFKMLLATDDAAMLEERGFSGEMTPAAVTEKFLEYLIKMVLNRYGVSNVDHLIVGAPETWFGDLNTLENRRVLRDICEGILRDIAAKAGEEPGSVQVVSEPAAACAYFAYNYSVQMRKNYEGSILLIDYGGGTLDNSLAKVSVQQDESGRQYMEITVLESNGAGENRDRKIGKAGIVYMESVVRAAICRLGLYKDQEIPLDEDFFQAVNRLEETLQMQASEIAGVFEENTVDDREALEEEELITIEYQGEDLLITYGLLVEVYDRVIRDEFAQKLDEMCQYIAKHGLSSAERERDDFKIALVGGFSNFYLVQKQVRDRFGLRTDDSRTRGIISNRMDCEAAVSYGAALLAADVIRIHKTAPYSIALLQKAGNVLSLDYAFRVREEIECDKVYNPLGKEDNEPVVTFIASGGIDQLVINFGHEDATAIPVPLKEEFKKRLRNLDTGQYHTAVIGFSLDRSDVLSIHVQEYDLLNRVTKKAKEPIELGKFSDIFETAKVQEVFPS